MFKKILFYIYIIVVVVDCESKKGKVPLVGSTVSSPPFWTASLRPPSKISSVSRCSTRTAPQRNCQSQWSTTFCKRRLNIASNHTLPLPIDTIDTDAMGARLIAFFVLTSINSVADAFVFEDWSVLLVASVILRLVAINAFIWWHVRSVAPSSSPGSATTTTPLVLPTMWWKALYVTPLLLNNLYWLDKMPFTWESDLWSVQVDFVVILWVVFLLESPRQDTTTTTLTSRLLHGDALGRTVQEMYACYYTAAGFWKINSHFLDPTSSCATVFLCQHLATVANTFRLTWETQVALAQRLAPTAPIGTLAVEMSMGLGLIMGRLMAKEDQARFWTRTGLWVILLFHLAVCLTPEPNNISLFALQCACRLVLLTDETALNEVGRQMLAMEVKLAILCSSVVVVAYGIQNDFTPLNWSFLFYVPVMFLLLSTLIVESRSGIGIEKGQSSPAEKRRPLWMLLATLVAFCYSFGTIVLGTMEEASCNMFSNLKIHGGTGNHLILPTGLLFDWFREAGDAHPYGGGEIRILSTTSNWLQEIYPNDMSHVLTPSHVSELLSAATSMPPPNFLNPGSNRVLGQRERGWIPPPPHGNFIAYSVPALEWKRLIKEAMKKDGDFEVSYAHLPGNSGDEVWRGTAWERKVDLSIKEGGVIAKCEVQFINGTLAVCQPSSDLPYHLEVPWLVQKIGMYHGYPLLHDSDGKTVRKSIQCFGP